MYETQAQVVLLVRAFEEADRTGAVLSEHARATASRRALRVTGLTDWSATDHGLGAERYIETVMRRARLLFDALLRKIPMLRGMLRLSQLGVGTAPAVILAGLALGFATNALWNFACCPTRTTTPSSRGPSPTAALWRSRPSTAPNWDRPSMICVPSIHKWCSAAISP